MTVRNVRTGKDVRLTRAMKLFANDRESVDEAFAGDVVGLANPGTFAIGDTLLHGRNDALRSDSRRSSRNISRWCAVSIPRATSRSRRGSRSCAKRARSRCSIPYGQTRIEPILAAVGALQFEVVKYRLESEYSVKTAMTTLAVHAGAQRHRRPPKRSRRAAAVERAAGRGLGRRRRWALRERVEHAAGGRVESRWLTFEPFGVRRSCVTVAAMPPSTPPRRRRHPPSPPVTGTIRRRSAGFRFPSVSLGYRGGVDRGYRGLDLRRITRQVRNDRSQMTAALQNNDLAGRRKDFRTPRRRRRSRTRSSAATPMRSPRWAS